MGQERHHFTDEDRRFSLSACALKIINRLRWKGEIGLRA